MQFLQSRLLFCVFSKTSSNLHLMKAQRYESINNIFSNAEKLKLIPDICIFKDSTEKSYDVMAM